MSEGCVSVSIFFCKSSNRVFVFKISTAQNDFISGAPLEVAAFLAGKLVGGNVNRALRHFAKPGELASGNGNQL
jgi:hypothetical protein